MTDQLSSLVNYKPIQDSTWTVKGIGGTVLPVRGQGDVNIVSNVNGQKMHCVIKGVLYVPGLGTNLFSIGAATSAGAQVHFSDDRVTLSKDGSVRMEGRRAGNALYHLDIMAVSTADEALPSFSQQSLPLDLWHQRLAHLNTQSILKMESLQCADGLSVVQDNSSHICDGCLLGKMHRSSFKTGRNRATEPGQLLHSDVCGPLQVPTPGGCRYFVIFKDDYTGWTFTYLLRNKSEVFRYLQDVVARVKSDTDNDVKVLRSDNGGEFFGTEINDWLAKRGIHHQSSTPHTPQQNGVAERTIRTVMEAARSQMYGRKVPTELWGEAVVAATYVLNRSLSSTSSATPFELWYGTRPDISNLRIFGSRVFAHVPDATRRKLDPKAQEGIFVGYSERSKAYRIWDPTVRKLIVSRDVQFDENNRYIGAQEKPAEYHFDFPLESVSLVFIHTVI